MKNFMPWKRTLVWLVVGLVVGQMAAYVAKLLNVPEEYQITIAGPISAVVFFAAFFYYGYKSCREAFKRAAKKRRPR